MKRLSIIFLLTLMMTLYTVNVSAQTYYVKDYTVEQLWQMSKFELADAFTILVMGEEKWKMNKSDLDNTLTSIDAGTFTVNTASSQTLLLYSRLIVLYFALDTNKITFNHYSSYTNLPESLQPEFLQKADTVKKEAQTLIEDAVKALIKDLDDKKNKND